MNDPPENVVVECYVDMVQIGRTDTANQTVPMQLYINLMWRDDRHANGTHHATPDSAADAAVDAPDEAWRPLVGVSNVEADWQSDASPVTMGYREPARDGGYLNMFTFCA